MINGTTIDSQSIRMPTLAMLVASVFLLGACSNDGSNGNTDPSSDPNVQNDPSSSASGLVASLVDGEGTSIRIGTSALGEVLVFGEQNQTLYTYQFDPTTGLSTCIESCEDLWPPALAPTADLTGDFSTVVRWDDSLQWSLQGRPLYQYSGDGIAGETNGDALGEAWYVARPHPITTGNTDLGDVLVANGSTSAGTGDPAQRIEFGGRTLYTFSNDPDNTSICTDECANVWPPIYADKGAVGANGYSTIDRGAGTAQWAFNGRPLYFFAGDAAPGDTNGEGSGGTWSVARPVQ